MLHTDNSAAPREFSAAEEWAAFAFPNDQFAAAFITFDTRRLRRSLGRQGIALLVELLSGFTFRITATTEELAESSLTVDHWFATIGAFVVRLLWLGHFTVAITRSGEFAIGIGTAGKKTAVFAKTIDHRLITFRTGIFRRLSLSLGVNHFLVGTVEIFLEWTVKFFQYLQPVKMLFLDLIELFFHVAGKCHVHNTRKMLD